MKKTVRAALTAALCLCLLAACAPEKEQKQADLAAFAQELQEKYEFAAYLTELDMEIDYNKELVNQTMPGLLDLELEQQILLMTMISLNNGEIDLIQAKNAEDAAKVQESLQARIDYMVGDGESPGGAFYPGPTQLWTNHSQVVVNGSYVMLVCGDDADAIVDDFNALFE